ncbi:MAG: TolC family protein [Candidatus Cloacimonetes bacterium]|nr:TolC family protein [Candidatus Cloacimonadota bacterium]
MHRARIARTLTLALAATAASAGVAGAQENVGQAGVAPAGAPAGAEVRRESLIRQTEAWDADPVDFWSALGDTTLTRLIREGLEANRQVDAAEARIASARAMRTEAALNLAPTITADAAYSRQRLASASMPGLTGPLPDRDIWEAGVQLSWELDLFGRNRNALQGRGALLDAAEEDVRGTQVVVAAEIARAYFELLGLEERLAVARRNAENQKSSLELTRNLLEAGRGTALDTERAQAQLSSTLAEIPALEAGISAARHRLSVLLGRAPGESDVLQPDATHAFELPARLRLSDEDDAVRRRPDVRSAASRVTAQREFVSSARANYLPRIAIGGVAGYTASEFDALGNSGTPRYAVGPVISWPLFDIGRVKTGVDEARAQQREAAAQHQQAVLQAQEEVRTSLDAFHRARERLHHLEEAAAASERATDLARLRFEEGGADFLEVLDAESRQLAAQDRLAAGRTEARAWLVAVYRAVGGMVLPER